MLMKIKFLSTLSLPESKKKTEGKKNQIQELVENASNLRFVFLKPDII